MFWLKVDLLMRFMMQSINQKEHTGSIKQLIAQLEFYQFQPWLRITY